MAEVRPLQFGSLEHTAALALRRIVLRDPGEPDFTPGEIHGEKDDAHFGLFAGEALVACLVLTPLENGLVQMRQVSVRSDLQRKGHGRTLVQHAEDYARAQGFRTMVFYARDNAVPFYRTLGYVSEADWFAEVGVPIQMMAKRL